MSKPRILWSIPYGMSARNLLRSEAYRAITSEAFVTILTPLHTDPEFVQEFKGQDVDISGYPKTPLWLKGWLKILQEAETLKWSREKSIKTFEIYEGTLRARKADNVIKTYAGVFSPYSRMLCRFPGLLNLLKREFFRQVIRSDFYNAILQNNLIDLVVLSHPYVSDERILAMWARHSGIRTTAIIHSWDNPTTKHKLLSRFNDVMVWNELMKEQMIALYDYCPEQIHVTGIPQCDIYTQPDIIKGRKGFLEQLGIRDDSNVITLACGNPDFAPRQEYLVELLVQAIDQSIIHHPTTLVIRLHPGQPMTAIRNLVSQYPNIVIDEPSIAYSATNSPSGWRNTEDDRLHFANLLKHSNVLINFFSTTTIDAAAMDTPVINVAFDNVTVESYYESLRKHYDFTHYRPILETGGVQVAHNKKELVTQINAYIDKPSIDREGRRRLVNQQCHTLDGKAGSRIGQFILEQISDLTNPKPPVSWQG